MRLYTVGFTQKTARKFFEILIRNNIKRVIDIRLNNKSQLAGFAKGEDLQYFLRELGDIEYLYIPKYAPTKDILDTYRKKEITWEEYEKKYLDSLEKRNILEGINYSIFENACLLCSESDFQNCHRRLLAEYLADHNREIDVIHL